MTVDYHRLHGAVIVAKLQAHVWSPSRSKEAQLLASVIQLVARELVCPVPVGRENSKQLVLTGFGAMPLSSEIP